MNILGILIIVILIIAVAVGFIVGLVKGFTKVKSWGVEYLLAAALSIAVGGACSGTAAQGDDGGIIAGIVTIIFTVIFAVGITFLFKLLRLIFRKLIKRKLERAAQASADGEEEETHVYYDDDDEDDEYEAPKKPRKAKKPSAGFVGFLNRILGGATLAVKGFVLFGAIFALILVALDLTQFAFVTDSMADIYNSSSYIAFKPAFMDLFLVGLIMIAINCGFNSGISGAVWSIIVIGLIVLAGLAAYHMAFNIESFQPAVDGISKMIAGEGEVSDLTVNIARGVLTAVIFIIMLVIIVLLSIFVPKLMEGLRENTVFNVIDGVLGAICATAIVSGLLLGIGAVLQPIYDLEFMEKLTSYFTDSKIATYFYDKDLLALMGMNLPIREWIGQ